jgi:hypothetical protein
LRLPVWLCGWRAWLVVGGPQRIVGVCWGHHSCP